MSALLSNRVRVPADGGWRRAAAYHGCRGSTFEGRWTPDLLALAAGLVLPFPPDPNGEAPLEGTSFAGPIVLGAAAWRLAGAPGPVRCADQGRRSWALRDGGRRGGIWAPAFRQLRAFWRFRQNARRRSNRARSASITTASVSTTSRRAGSSRISASFSRVTIRSRFL